MVAARARAFRAVSFVSDAATRLAGIARQRLSTALRHTALAQPLGEAIALLILCPILLSVAIWNGFPLIFYDTGAYVLEGLGHVFLPERSSVYSLFLDFVAARLSFWCVVVVQAAMTSFLIVQFARCEAPSLTAWSLALLMGTLVIFTGIGWYVGEVEPDCMTALVVLATYLLAFRRERLGRTRALLTFAIGGVAVASHPAHLALAAGLCIVLLFFRVLARARPLLGLPRPSLFPLAVLGLGLSLVLAGNFELTHSLFVSRSGPVFVFSRLLQDGIVKRLLDERCPKAGYALCKYKDMLPTRADQWLWDPRSPFNKLNRFVGTATESERIVIDCLERYPLLNLESALRAGAVQFFRFKTGDQIEPQEWILYPALHRFVPGQMASYMQARQQQGRIRFAALNALHVAAGALSLIVLALFTASLLGARDWESAIWPVLLFVALIGNAFICGALSNPHDRYQSRLMWLPAFTLVLMVPAKLPLSLRKPIESGT